MINPVIDDINDRFQMALTLGKTSIAKYEFNYVVPETGNYYLWTKWFHILDKTKLPVEAIRILVDGEEVYNVSKRNGGSDLYSRVEREFNWTKDDIHTIQMGIVNETPSNWSYQKSWIDLRFTNDPNHYDKNDNKDNPAPSSFINYDINHHCVVPEVKLSNSPIQLIHNYIESKEFVYKNREIDYTTYRSTARKMVSDYATAIDPQNYAFVPADQSATVKTLKTDVLKKLNNNYKITRPYFWSEDKFKTTYTPSSINATFDQPQTLNQLKMTLPKGNEARLAPDYWIVTITQEDGNVIKLPVQGDGNPPSQDIVVNFNQTINDIKDIQVDIFHINKQGKDPGGVAIDQMLFYNNGSEINNRLYQFTYKGISKTSKDLDYSPLNSPTSRFEIWDSKPVPGDDSLRYAGTTFNTVFKDPSTINTICISKGNYWTEHFANWVNIQLVHANGSVTDLGNIKNPQEGASDWFIKLDRTYNDIVKIKMSICRALPADTQGHIALVLGRVRFFSTDTNLDNAIGINDPAIKLSGNLTYNRNDPEVNYSNINGVYLKSSSEDDVIEFTLGNTDQFTLLGRKGPNDGSFDVFINDTLVSPNVSCNSSNVEMNVPVYTYINDNHLDKMKVRIVNKSDKPLYFNSILTYGNNTSY